MFKRSMTFSPADIAALDAADPLASLRDRFEMPDGIIYLDGNSLGALPRGVRSRMDDVVARQWGRDLIRGWNVHDWIDLPGRLGDRIAPLIGAETGTVTVADSTSINIFKLLVVALKLRPDRRVIVSETGNFPTDLYMAEGVADLLGRGHALRTAPAAELAGLIDETVAVVLLTEVNYRTGARLDMAALTRRAHDKGALVIWDLAHSAGAFPVDLAGADADFAVGCGYKYLNGGPGAPAFAYVAPRHLPGLAQPLTGWLGHAEPFRFAEHYRPAEGIAALRVGTPAILAMSALDAALDAFEGADLVQVRHKADSLFELFVGTLDAAGVGLELLTPRDPTQRGTQVSLRHDSAYAVMQALIARGVIGDFREPDILRFGLTPLYLRHADVAAAAAVLVEVLQSDAWRDPRLAQRAKVV
jgi:kynureninase